MRTICCMCQRLKIDNAWVFDNPEPHGRLSHGFCPDCYQAVIVRLGDKQMQIRSLEKTSGQVKLDAL